MYLSDSLQENHCCGCTAKVKKDRIRQIPSITAIRLNDGCNFFFVFELLSALYRRLGNCTESHCLLRYRMNRNRGAISFSLRFDRFKLVGLTQKLLFAGTKRHDFHAFSPLVLAVIAKSPIPWKFELQLPNFQLQM